MIYRYSRRLLARIHHPQLELVEAELLHDAVRRGEPADSAGSRRDHRLKRVYPSSCPFCALQLPFIGEKCFECIRVDTLATVSAKLSTSSIVDTSTDTYCAHTPPSYAMDSVPPATRGQDRCNLDVYTLFGESTDGPIGVAPAIQDNRLPRVTVVPIPTPEPRQLPVGRQSRGSAVVFEDGTARARLLSDESEAPFSAGCCRQLAAMYTDVGMSTVERVRWLCGWMVLVYALTCCAWFAWPAYTVPVVGVLTGTAGLLACQRPHERTYLTYVLMFLALNYAQLVLLVWLVVIELPAELTATCTGNCAGEETKAVFIVLLVLATGIFHWRVVMTTRLYVREFRMVEQLQMQGSQAFFLDASYSRAAASSTMATDVQSRSSASVVSVSAVGDAEQHLPRYHPQATRL